MKKMRWILFLAAILCVMAVSPALAGWNCPGCGTENDTRFCQECGADQPAMPLDCPFCGHDLSMLSRAEYCPFCGDLLKSGTVAMSMKGGQLEKDGTVTISWKDARKLAPYQVSVRQILPDKRGPEIIIGEDVGDPYLNYDRLVPGKTYAILITDREGNQLNGEYTVPLNEFPDSTGSVKDAGYVKLYSSARGTYNKGPFSWTFIRDKEMDIVHEYNFRSYPNRFDEMYIPQWAVETPSGLAWIIRIKRGGEFPIRECFDQMVAEYGDIEYGQYKILHFWNGLHVADSTFEIIE